MSVELAFAGGVEPVKGRREITGLLVEWDQAAATGGQRWRFARGSLRWTRTAHVKLNTNHTDNAIGVALDLQDTRRGLWGRFRVGRGPEGDRVLELAEDGVLDGFSIEVIFEGGDRYGRDPRDENVMLVKRGRLSGVAITATPAYDNARLESVAASRNGGQAMVNRVDAQLDAELGGRVAATAAAEGVSTAEIARRGLAYVTKEPAPYRFDGSSEHSFVRDYWRVNVEGEQLSEEASAARGRLDKFREQHEQAKRAAFAASTSSHGAIVEPAYEPLLTLTQADRPFADAASTQRLDGPTPFTLPGDADPTDAVSEHTEGTNPPESTWTMDGAATVAPQGYSGWFRLTREIVDSSNPALDSVAVAMMRESYARQTEAQVYAELNTAQSGTITGGRSPAGAQVSTAAAGDLPAELKAALARYPFGRLRKARAALCSAEATEALSGALDETTGTDTAMWRVQGARVNPAAAITGNASGDADVFILSAADLWVWESPLLTFRFFERAGPAYVDMALYGYFATKLLRPVGLSAIRYTAA